jgi:ubiquinone biosynthesis protein UbiJ
VTSLPVAAFLNHLLESAPWARERLAPFAGRTWRVELAPLPDLSFVVRESGMLETSDAAEANLVVTLMPAAIPALARRDETVLREMTFAGDAELAAALQYLFRHLEWDIEEDLSVVGDIGAPLPVARATSSRVKEARAPRQNSPVPDRGSGRHRLKRRYPASRAVDDLRDAVAAKAHRAPWQSGRGTADDRAPSARDA